MQRSLPFFGRYGHTGVMQPGGEAGGSARFRGEKGRHSPEFQLRPCSDTSGAGRVTLDFECSAGGRLSGTPAADCLWHYGKATRCCGNLPIRSVRALEG